MRIGFSLILPLSVFCAACANSADDSQKLSAKPAATQKSEAATVETTTTDSEGKEPLENLPYARGNSFATLDAYLAYLEKYNGPIDLPYWRRIGPDEYEFMTTMTGRERETATRAELMERYGFTQ